MIEVFEFSTGIGPYAKMKWIRISIAAATFTMALAHCKPTSTESRRSPVLGGDAIVQPPGPISSERSEAELRAAFADVILKYRNTAQSTYATSAIARSLQPKRKLKTLNVKMRDPVVMIAKTAKLTGSADLGAPIRASGGVIKKQLNESNVVNVEFPDATDERYLAAVMDFLKSDARIEIVEPDFVVKTNAAPNDPRFSELWGMANPSSGVDIKAVSSWDLTTGSRSVIVGIIDSGIDCTHQDLAANCWINPGESGTDSQGRNKRSNGVDDDGNGYIDDWQGWNFVNGTNKPADDNHHGTHVAGTIGALGNNAIGVVGVNWLVSMVPLKFLDSTGSGYISDALAALDYATKMKFFATNNSWGGGGYSDLMALAIGRANGANSLFIAAAGNEQNDNDANASYPASYIYPNVVAVAAVDINGNMPWFSNYGARTVAVAAPGVDILSSTPGNNYEKMSGTSMACPHVTGTLALLKAKFPSATGIELIARLMDNSTPRSSLTNRVRSGAVINAYAAMNSTSDTTPPSPPSNLKVSQRTMDSFTLEWTPSGDDGTSGAAASYKIRIADTSISSPSDWNKATEISAQITVASGKVTAALQKLQMGYSGYLAVRAYDEVGNESPLSESIELKLIALHNLQFYDGTSLTDLPANTQWTLEDDPARGKVYSDGVGSYPPNAKRRMMLRDIPIKGVQKLVLQYWTSYSLEDPYDRGDVYVAPRGATETTPFRIDFVTGKNAWQLRKIDLTEYALGQAGHGAEFLQIYFELTSDAYVQYEGWLLDDIAILINDSQITLTGIPDGTTKIKNLNVGISAPSGTLYSAKFIQSNDAPAADCSLNTTYANPVPQTSIAQPLVLTQDSTLKKFLCVRALVPGYSSYVNTWAAWGFSNADAVVQATGFPTKVSNAKNFTITVSAVSPGSATSYSTALIRSQPESKDAACSSASLAWSSWTPLSQPGTFNVEPITQGADGYLALCLRGKDDAGTIQITPTAYGWMGDFTGPIIAIESSVPAVTNLTNFSVKISGPADLASCAATLFAGYSNCPTTWSSYGSCAISPASYLVGTSNDGPYTLCILGKDSAGNISPEPKFLKWTRVTAPPVAILTGTPPVSNKSPTGTIQVSGVGVATYRYATAAAISQCSVWSTSRPATTPIQLSLISKGDGLRALCVLAKDEAGNEQISPTTISWIQDTTVNNLVFSDLPSTTSNAQSLNVKVSANEGGTYRAMVLSGSSCDPTNLATAQNRPLTEKILFNLPLADGTYTLCASLTDNAGNEQAVPTGFTWLKDTVPPVAILTETPPKETTDQTVNAKVSGTGVVDYQWGIMGGITNCNTVVYGPYALIATRLTANAGAPGIKVLCVKGRDSAGNLQPSPTPYRWTLKSPLPPVATIASGAPFTPTGNTTWSIQIGGERVVSWQHALAYSQSTICNTGTVYGPFNPVASSTANRLRITDSGADGFRTLCVKGQDSFGTIQTNPTIIRWIKLTGASLADNAGIYGTITRSAPSGGTENLTIQRTSAQKPAENLNVRICQITPANGRLANCITTMKAMPVNATTANFSFTNISAGPWVVIVLPPQGRGRVEPLVINK